MKPGIKKKMRVATTFTGVAACAALGAPQALAAAPKPAGDTQALKGAGVRMTPYVVGRSCTAGTSNWFHLAYNKQSDICFGYTGPTSFSPPLPATSFCGGNNHGYIEGVFESAMHLGYLTTFGAGTTYFHIPGATKTRPLLITAMSISFWAGHDKCPFP